jgi:hypothetical protein
MKNIFVAVFASLALAALAGCASYQIPTPMGVAKLNTFCKTVGVPKIAITENNATFVIEGYASQGDAEVITASAGAIGAIVGAGVKAAKK